MSTCALFNCFFPSSCGAPWCQMSVAVSRYRGNLVVQAEADHTVDGNGLKEVWLAKFWISCKSSLFVQIASQRHELWKRRKFPSRVVGGFSFRSHFLLSKSSNPKNGHSRNLPTLQQKTTGFPKRFGDKRLLQTSQKQWGPAVDHFLFAKNRSWARSIAKTIKDLKVKAIAPDYRVWCRQVSNWHMFQRQKPAGRKFCRGRLTLNASQVFSQSSQKSSNEVSCAEDTHGDMWLLGVRHFRPPAVCDFESESFRAISLVTCKP